jgi:phosphohistidine phosphatase
MKKIHLIRHAKSSWKKQHLADIDRPLNRRGVMSIQIMAPHVINAGCGFEHVFSSPARRAQSTIELLSKNVGICIKWNADKKLFCFDSNTLHRWFVTLDETITEPVIIGHNPALTDFCNELSNSKVSNIPTCGYVQLTAHEDFHWSQISNTSFELTRFLTPKELMLE